jgi:hypothetical protein
MGSTTHCNRGRLDVLEGGLYKERVTLGCEVEKSVKIA